ncbi:MAG: hypothetical protein JOZ07_15340 [Solirubrobacterales bacterium]|nr:hypothetical protein [Solirubrobacterales bacterium]
MTPRSISATRYERMRWTEMASGGHFAAMERPSELIADVRAFYRQAGVRNG